MLASPPLLTWTIEIAIVGGPQMEFTTYSELAARIDAMDEVTRRGLCASVHHILVVGCRLAACP